MGGGLFFDNSLAPHFYLRPDSWQHRDNSDRPLVFRLEPWYGPGGNRSPEAPFAFWGNGEGEARAQQARKVPRSQGRRQVQSQDRARSSSQGQKLRGSRLPGHDVPTEASFPSKPSRAHGPTAPPTPAVAVPVQFVDEPATAVPASFSSSAGAVEHLQGRPSASPGGCPTSMAAGGPENVNVELTAAAGVQAPVIDSAREESLTSLAHGTTRFGPPSVPPNPVPDSPGAASPSSIRGPTTPPAALATAVAASRIQAAYRGYLVRRSEPLKLLKVVAGVRSDLDLLRRQLAEPGEVERIRRSDGKERLRMSEGLMALLLRLDTVQSANESVRAVRKVTARQVISLMDDLDAISVPQADPSPQPEVTGALQGEAAAIRGQVEGHSQVLPQPHGPPGQVASGGGTEGQELTGALIERGEGMKEPGLAAVGLAAGTQAETEGTSVESATAGEATAEEGTAGDGGDHFVVSGEQAAEQAAEEGATWQESGCAGNDGSGASSPGGGVPGALLGLWEERALEERRGEGAVSGVLMGQDSAKVVEEGRVGQAVQVENQGAALGLAALKASAAEAVPVEVEFLGSPASPTGKAHSSPSATSPHGSSSHPAASSTPATSCSPRSPHVQSSPTPDEATLATSPAVSASPELTSPPPSDTQCPESGRTPGQPPMSQSVVAPLESQTHAPSSCAVPSLPTFAKGSSNLDDSLPSLQLQLFQGIIAQLAKQNQHLRSLLEREEEARRRQGDMAAKQAATIEQLESRVNLLEAAIRNSLAVSGEGVSEMGRFEHHALPCRIGENNGPVPVHPAEMYGKACSDWIGTKVGDECGNLVRHHLPGWVHVGEVDPESLSKVREHAEGLGPTTNGQQGTTSGLFLPGGPGDWKTWWVPVSTPPRQRQPTPVRRLPAVKTMGPSDVVVVGPHS